MKQKNIRKTRYRILPWVVTAVCVAATTAVQAQPMPPPFRIEARTVSLGAEAVPSGPIGPQAPMVLSNSVVADKAPWMQIRFGDYNLGEASYLLLSSGEDGAQQRLNAQSMKDWNNSSAIFNGERVDMELHIAPGETGIYAKVQEVVVGEWLGQAEGTGGAESLCGTDNRIDSTDTRVGRLFFGGCTAFLVSNGAVLTAGHCADFDPDGGGSQLPDGVRDLSGVVEFNIPKSRLDGTVVAAHPDHQYPINTGVVTWRYDGEGQGVGKDWTVFAVNPNSNTGARAHVARGFFRMTNLSPAALNTARITGCGSDDGEDNRSLQTSTGSYVGEWNNGTDFYHQYSVDTTGASSGSPIIWESNGFTIGIHTNGGCTSTGGSNGGTSFEVNALEAALQGFGGGTRRYVDLVSASGTQNGLVFNPYATVTAGVTGVPTGGRLVLVEGTYTKANGNTPTMGADGKAFLVEAPVGTVTIGN